MRTVTRIGEWIGTAVVVVAVLLVGFTLIGPRFGWETHPVLSGSMEPALPVGSVIVTRPEGVEDIGVGDIITYQIEGNQKITHRVVEVVQDGDRRMFRTKGDANNDSDPALVSSNAGQMRMVVLDIPYVGFATNLVKNRLAFALLVGLPAAGLVALLLKDVWAGVQEERGKGLQKRGVRQ